MLIDPLFVIRDVILQIPQGTESMTLYPIADSCRQLCKYFCANIFFV